MLARRHPQPHYVPDRNTPVAKVVRLRGIVIAREWVGRRRDRTESQRGHWARASYAGLLASHARGPAHGQHAIYAAPFPCRSLDYAQRSKVMGLATKPLPLHLLLTGIQT